VSSGIKIPVTGAWAGEEVSKGRTGMVWPSCISKTGMEESVAC